MLSLKNLQVGIAVFKFGTGFGLIVREFIYIWSGFHEECVEYIIANDFERDRAYRYINAIRASDLENQNSIIFSLCDYFYKGIGRYYCILEIKDGAAKWNRVGDYSLYKELPFNQYPQIDSPIKKGWLVIQDLLIKNGSIYFFTVGEEKNHYKYGMDMAILSKNDLDGNIITIREIEKGYGSFSSSKDYLIVRPLNNKSKLILYKLDDNSENALTLNTKRNLGNLNKDF